MDAGREKFTFQEINLKAELRYKDIIIDLEKREVIRGNRRIVLTYTKYKTAPSEEEQEKARQEYLDKRGVSASYRW